ncbi:MAG: hypothetical protein GXY33_15230, partial [Phycisphaerae bacterium]|nr:hypothetical protein [Phycisphaerae bacterium]
MKAAKALVCLFIAVSVGFSVSSFLFVGGCGGDPTDPTPTPTPSASPTPTPSDALFLPQADQEVLEDAADSYLANRETQSADAAFAAMVSDLKACEGVAKAEPTVDGQTVWVEFDDGQIAAVGIAGRFGPAPTYDASQMLAKLDGGASAAKVVGPGDAAAKIASSAKIGPADSPKTPGSRKVLLLSSASEEFAGLDVELFQHVRDDLVENYGWDPSDVVIKSNLAADEYGTLIFNDFLQLADYGVITICAHGRLSHPPEESFFVQVTAEKPYRSKYPRIGHPDEPFHVGDEWKKERVLSKLCIDPFKTKMRWYLYMRDDLWVEHLATLPESIVYLCIPESKFVLSDFGSLHAGHAIVWDGTPASVNPCLNPVLLPEIMAGDNAPAVEAWETLMAGSTAFGSATVSLELTGPGAVKYYLPTWADVGTYGCPSTTATVKVEVSYTNPDVPLPDPAVVQDLPHVGKEFVDLYPGEEITFKAAALDAGGNVLAEKERKVTLHSGANVVRIRFAEYGIILRADPDEIDADGVDASTLTATLKKFTDTDELIPTGDPVPGKSVSFGKTAGEFVGPNPVDSDAGGVASVQFVGDTSIVAQVKAVVFADSVESDPVNVVCGDPEYNVVVQADPPVVVFDYGDTAEIVFTATARYCL